MWNRGEMNTFWSGVAVGAVMGSVISMINSNNNSFTHKMESGTRKFTNNVGHVLNNLSKMLS